MAYNFLPCNRNQTYLLPPSLTDWLPEDQLAWFVLDAVEQIEVEKDIRRFLRGHCKFTISVRQSDSSYRDSIQKPSSRHKSQAIVKNVVQWLRDSKSVHLPPEMKAPCGFSKEFKDRIIVSMKNGLFDVTDSGNPVLKPLSPDYYTFNYCTFDYDSNATAPTWQRALGQYFQNEDGTLDLYAQEVLHSWMKKIIFRDTSPQKIFAIIGRRRSGKGTIGRVLKSLVGDENVTSMTIIPLQGIWLAALAEQAIGHYVGCLRCRQKQQHYLFC